MGSRLKTGNPSHIKKQEKMLYSAVTNIFHRLTCYITEFQKGNGQNTTTE